jgi:hypothetical protein
VILLEFEMFELLYYCHASAMPYVLENAQDFKTVELLELHERVDIHGILSSTRLTCV